MSDITRFQGVPNPVPDNDGLDDARLFHMMLPGGLTRFQSLTDYMRSLGWIITEIGGFEVDLGPGEFITDFGPYGGDQIGHSHFVRHSLPSIKVHPKTHGPVGDNRIVMARYEAYEPVFICNRLSLVWGDGRANNKEWKIWITAGVIEKIPLIDIFKVLQARDPELWDLGIKDDAK